jgi:hypothetical protein
MAQSIVIFSLSRAPLDGYFPVHGEKANSRQFSRAASRAHMNSSATPAVIIAHPGHELRVHHWLEQAKPAVCVLTDGSGHTQKSRLDSTTGVLSSAGAVAGPVYGRFTDADMYAAVRRADHVIFTKLADELADWLVAGGFTEVAGDAIESYNTSHDVCRYLISAAAEIARRRTGRELTLWQFLLVGPPDSCPGELRARNPAGCGSMMPRCSASLPRLRVILSSPRKWPS